MTTFLSLPSPRVPMCPKPAVLAAPLPRESPRDASTLRRAIRSAIVRENANPEPRKPGCRTASITLAHLSDDQLLSHLADVCLDSRRLLARLLLLLIEVEDRRLDLRSACSSLYDFCRRRLAMSESEAVRRIEAARLVKRFPSLLGHLERGDVHISALLLLREHFTEENVAELVAAAAGKTKREVQELLAARAPRPDVMATITELPGPIAPPGDRAPATSPSHLPSPAQVPPAARLEPLSPARHRLELTVSADVRTKLERARDLLGHRIPHANLEAVLDQALDALLAKLEKERLARTERPRKEVRGTKPGRIPQAVRREVFARDGERCTFTDAEGNRCESRTRLELDHLVPRARGGPDDAANLRVACRAHNRLHAEQDFGREHVENTIRLRRSRSPARASDVDAEDSTVDVAAKALTRMGFRREEVRRALRRVRPPDAGGAMPEVAELLRSALGVLAP